MNLQDQHELFNDAWETISKELAKLRDAGVTDEEIYKFARSVINHYDPAEKERLQKLSDHQDALWKQANDL